MDLTLLKALEKEKVLEVLQRDKVLRSVDDERVRRLRSELQICRREAVSVMRQYGERMCARCQRPLGQLWNCGAVCHSCSHRICAACRVVSGKRSWKCTVCHAYRELKIKSGEWFLEERAKKFPVEAEKYECMGEKLLKSYQRLSHIYVVPPTPPPFGKDPSLGKAMDLHNSKPFTKSVENLFVSFTTHIKKISKSQNDMSVDQDLLTEDYCKSPTREKRSLSDTAINKSSTAKDPSLRDLPKKVDSLDGHLRAMGSDDNLPTGSGYAGNKRNSTSSCCSEFTYGGGVSGEIQLAVAYNFRKSSLEITVGACKDLADGDPKRSKCHPYVKIYLLPIKFPARKLKTSIKKNTVNPIFKETFSYKIEQLQLDKKTLQVSVWHSGTLRRKAFLGEVLIPLQGWRFGDEITEAPVWYQLCPKSKQSVGGALEWPTGSLLVKVNLSSASQEGRVQYQRNEIHFGQIDISHLTVMVTGARNLSVSKPGTETFVKGCLSGAEHRGITQVTPASSQWGHKLVFSDVYKVHLLESCLELELWEHTRSGLGERLLGSTRLSGDLIWQQIQHEPNGWHSLTLPMEEDGSRAV
uniref:Synaptotagmin like 3 n=1 Tax=Paramormyrops kingsleyae TaxID=1676925 RepID=A0A3B3QE14_9TELE|nr:synaptotagmin-like protein 3 isoform X1 [Paramormyrops kingsleyae]XP_023695164.1 synaptotagmin-like protein 3 isoform X1 [Paramormyrops kingsleyae]XP_023695165.1 synaptotagmin-like protein 3 isoform X1 [Paramormyrops kingsleyae]XP_023695166.1 synaptotagmin-like protein 3 isoform X1 [Paramormyrops kingsleyae]XP_023695167.1 synaptotagmin-like protein 3 isoform X1 [Paramormyrops kingsleyae]